MKKKIEELKTRAHVIKRSADEIKGEIGRKIKRRMEENEKKIEVNTPPVC